MTEDASTTGERENDQLLARIAGLVSDWWSLKQTPFLLSDLGLALTKEGIDYKRITEPSTFAKYLERQTSSGIKVVRHEKQRAKIGLIPRDESFEYESEVQGRSSSAQTSLSGFEKYRSRKGKYLVIDFLEALADFSEEELAGVHLPVSVLVKIVTSR
jgi:hypothetical protein